MFSFVLFANRNWIMSTTIRAYADCEQVEAERAAEFRNEAGRRTFGQEMAERRRLQEEHRRRNGWGPILPPSRRAQEAAVAAVPSPAPRLLESEEEEEEAVTREDHIMGLLAGASSPAVGDSLLRGHLRQDRTRSPPLRQTSQEGRRVLDGSDDDSYLEDVGGSLSEAEQHYIASERSTAVLLSMCLGLDNQGRIIAEFDDDEIYKKHLKCEYVPKVPHLKKEIRRRATILDIRVRRNSALKPECVQWLRENPLVSPADKAFLLAAEAALYAAMVEVDGEQRALDQERLLSANWIGPKPWL